MSTSSQPDTIAQRWPTSKATAAYLFVDGGAGDPAPLLGAAGVDEASGDEAGKASAGAAAASAAAGCELDAVAACTACATEVAFCLVPSVSLKHLLHIPCVPTLLRAGRAKAQDGETRAQRGNFWLSDASWNVAARAVTTAQRSRRATPIRATHAKKPQPLEHSVG